MINANFRLDVLASLLRGRTALLYGALEAKMDLLDTRLQQRIQNQKLSGQVLRQRSGKLKRSIEVIPATSNRAEGKITGGVRGAGGPAYYGRFHEFGTTEPYTIVPVTKQALRFMIGNKVIFARRVTHPPIEERSFMRSAQQEMEEEYIGGMQQTAYDVFSARPR